MSDTDLVGQVLERITCRFCHGKGRLNLGKNATIEIMVDCHPCCGTGLLHPDRLSDIKEEFASRA